VDFGKQKMGSEMGISWVIPAIRQLSSVTHFGGRIERFGKPKNIEVGTEMGRKTFNITVEGISSSTHFNTHCNFGNIHIREMGTV
jgi:hypothetical protein